MTTKKRNRRLDDQRRRRLLSSGKEQRRNDVLGAVSSRYVELYWWLDEQSFTTATYERENYAVEDWIENDVEGCTEEAGRWLDWRSKSDTEENDQE